MDVSATREIVPPTEPPARSHSGKTRSLARFDLWAHSEGQPWTEGTFTRTLNVGDLCQNSGECQGGSREYGVVDNPIAKLRQASPQFS